MFQIKDFASIAASMMNYAKATQNKLTDFTVGSAVRTVLECAAIEMDELYQQMWWGLKEAIPVAVYAAFDFARLPATAAQGMVTLTLSAGEAFTLQAGTRFTSVASSAVVYATLVDVAVAQATVETTLEVQVSSINAGVTTAVLAGTGFSAAVPRLTAAVAKADFSVGSDEETDTQRQQRFIAYVQNLGRSTETALAYGATTVALLNSDGVVVEAVKFARVAEVVVGDVVEAHCYIHNGIDGASAALLAACDQVLRGYTDADGVAVPGWKAAGVKLVVAATSNVAVDLAGEVTLVSGADAAVVAVEIEAALTAYLAGLDSGQAVLVAELVAAAMGVAGVANIKLTAPAADVAVNPYEKAIKGAYAFT